MAWQQLSLYTRSISDWTLCQWTSKTIAKSCSGLGVGTLMLLAPFGFRMIDPQLRVRLPLRIHFLWHLMNTVMLGWVIEV